jgi:hypothetical protein
MFAEYFKLTKNEIFTSKPELRKFRRSRNPPESDYTSLSLNDLNLHIFIDLEEKKSYLSVYRCYHIYLKKIIA